MIVTAWNNGAHSRNGVGYGIRIPLEDRDIHFKPEWTQILIELQGEPEPVEIAIDQEKLWGEGEHPLVDARIGRWLRREGLAPVWMGNPARMAMEGLGENRFSLSKVAGESEGHRRRGTGL